MMFERIKTGDVEDRVYFGKDCIKMHSESTVVISILSSTPAVFELFETDALFLFVLCSC